MKHQTNRKKGNALNMNNLIKIVNSEIIIKEYKGQRVVTLKDIDMLHERVEGTAGRNFRENRKQFIENEDYFEINQPDEIRHFGFTRPQGGVPQSVLLITESGYLMLVKSLTDDLAWKVQRELVKSYFNVSQMPKIPQTFSQALRLAAEQAEEIERLQEENQVMLPKAEYHDEVLNKPGLILSTTIAKDIGLTSANKLHKLMNISKIIYNKSGVWTPYADYEWLLTDGYASYRSYREDNARLILMWTEKGRKWITENINCWLNRL